MSYLRFVSLTVNAVLNATWHPDTFTPKTRLQRLLADVPAATEPSRYIPPCATTPEPARTGRGPKYHEYAGPMGVERVPNPERVVRYVEYAGPMGIDRVPVFDDEEAEDDGSEWKDWR